MPIDTTITYTGEDKMRAVCDNCSRIRKRCDRVLPRCSNCTKKDIECTRHRKIRHKDDTKRDKLYVAQRINVLGKFTKVTNKNNSKEKDINKYKKTSIELINLNNNHEKNIIKCKKINNGLINLSSKVEVQLFKKSILNFNFNELGIYPFKLFHIDAFFDKAFSHLYQSNPTLRVYLALKNYKKTTLIKTKIKYNLNSTVQNMLINRALVAYFEYINPELPLFNPFQFFKNPRCYTLRLAILLSGLSLLPEEEHINQFANNIKNLLLNELKPSSIKPSLGYIQTLIVLKHGLRGYSFSLPSYCNSNLIHKIKLLGIHLRTYNKLSANTIFERKLAFAAALYLENGSDMFVSNNFESHYYIYYPETVLKDTLLDSITIKDTISYFIIKDCLIMTEFRILFVKHLSKCFNLLNQASKMQILASAVLIQARKGLDNIAKVTHLSMIKLYQLNIETKSNLMFKKYIDIQISLLIIETNAVIMHLYEIIDQASNLPGDSIFVAKVNSQKPKNINSIIRCGQKIVAYNQTLELNPYASTRILSLLFALRTIQVYATHHSEAVNIMQMGFALLENLKNVNSYSNIINASLDLTKIVVEIESRGK